MDKFSFPCRCTMRQILTLGVFAGLALLTTCASQTVKRNTEVGALRSHFASFMNEASIKTTNSLRESFDVFVWAFQGDPLRAYIDTEAQKGSLEQRRLAILSRTPALQSEPQFDRTHNGATVFGPGLDPL
jgi:hypothetical protein